MTRDYFQDYLQIKPKPAMEINDLMTLKALGEGNGLSPYEQYKVGYMQQKQHTSGIGVAGLVLGTVGAAVGIGASKDLLANISGNAISYTLYWLGKTLLRNL